MPGSEAESWRHKEAIFFSGLLPVGWPTSKKVGFLKEGEGECLRKTLMPRSNAVLG